MLSNFRFVHALFDFISLYLFVFILAMKLKNRNYKNSLKYFSMCNQGKRMSDLKISHGKMFDFVSFP